MPLKCVAVDDEPLALELVKGFVKKIPGLELVKSFNDAVACASFLKLHAIDLLFVDVNMPDLSGIQMIQQLVHKPMIIFITAHKNFALEGFELDALDYLLKPVSFERFEKAVAKAIDYYHYRQSGSKDENGSLFVHAEYRLVKIEFAHIDYIESLEDYIRIYVDNGKPVLTLMPLKSVLEKLPVNLFRRIHRGFIVSMKKVQSAQHRKLRLVSGKELPVSKTYQHFMADWQKGK
jgi:DNA-binding LytR/AlgR family response regulator